MTTRDKEILRIQSTIVEYQEEVARSEKRLQAAAIDAGTYLRYLLAPILHRWGMGMRKGGALLYPEPNVHLMAQGKWEVEMHKECDYALGVVHPELAEALWMQVDLFPYEETLHDYVDDIPLPTGDGYVWVMKDISPEPYGPSYHVIEFMDGTTESHIPRSSVYYGPVRLAYIEDISYECQVTEYIDTLPRYVLNEERQWELQSTEVPE